MLKLTLPGHSGQVTQQGGRRPAGPAPQNRQEIPVLPAVGAVGRTGGIGHVGVCYGHALMHTINLKLIRIIISYIEQEWSTSSKIPPHVISALPWCCCTQWWGGWSPSASNWATADSKTQWSSSSSRQDWPGSYSKCPTLYGHCTSWWCARMGCPWATGCSSSTTSTGTSSTPCA